ncbi:MAG TPA: hypothetical protein VE986_05530 [Hyphomicrobiales bacterium]|nr:hypothetical protein [Hyphomicrobiales bacterium]
MSLRLLIVAVGCAALANGASGADQGIKSDQRRAPYKECCEEPYRFIYAEGWYGNAKVVAPVRHGPFGDEVLIPGGPWMICQLSCEMTLRKQNLYYWHDFHGQGKTLSPGYPRKDFYLDDWGIRHDYLF